MQSQHSLFGIEEPRISLSLKDAPPATSEEKLSWEKELLGFYLSDHPLRSYEAKIKALKTPPLQDALKEKDENKLLRVIGLVSKIQKTLTKSGQPMLFATLEDFSLSPLEVIVFNNTLAKTAPVWEANNVVIVQGRMSWRNSEPKMICDKAMKLER
jgi:DNA polymerase-3 subunit alpha